MKAGSTFRDQKRRLCHVIAVCDSGTKDGSVVTYRFWRRSKQRWEYSAELLWVIEEFYFSAARATLRASTIIW